MARPSKSKRICELPKANMFRSNNTSSNTVVTMTTEEYECFRLIDYECHNQNEAALIMGVARTTVTKLYTDARRKIAIYLVEGKKLVVTGGNFTICDKTDQCRCSRRGDCGTFLMHKDLLLKNKEAKIKKIE